MNCGIYCTPPIEFETCHWLHRRSDKIILTCCCFRFSLGAVCYAFIVVGVSDYFTAACLGRPQSCVGTIQFGELVFGVAFR
jgi:hypothetical protein